MRLRPTALLVGLLIASPALWRSLVEGTMPAGTALQRTLLSLVVASVGAAVFEAVVRPYLGGSGGISSARPGGPQRRAGDLPAPRTAADAEHGPGRVSMGGPAAGTGGAGGIGGVGGVSGGTQ